MAKQTRNISSLIQDHAAFLNLVRHHGEGSVTLKEFTSTDQKSRGRMIELHIDNASKKNAMSGRMMFDLAGIVDRLQQRDFPENDTVTTLLITSSRCDVFCSGADLQLVKNVVNTPEKGLQMSLFMNEALSRLRSLPLISVCVIDGKAIGGGSELITTSDYRIMRTNDAKKDNTNKEKDSTPYIQFVHAKLGVSPGWGGGSRLIDIVGRRHALKIMAASPRISPEDALNMGLVDTLYCDDQDKTMNGDGANSKLAALNSLLDPFHNQPFPRSVRGIKRIVGASVKSECERIKTEQEVFSSLWGGADNSKALGKA